MIRFLALLLSALALSGQTGDLLEKADAAFRSGDPREAAALARQALARDPRLAHAHLILGVIAAAENEWGAAEKRFQAVIRLEPRNPHGYFYLGQARLYQKQWEQAIRYLSQALAYDYPDRQRLMVELALGQNEAGRPEAALDSLSKVPAPGEGPQAAQYHAVQAFALGKLNRPAAALEAIRRALERDNSSPHYWGFLISTLISADETSAALAEAIRAQKKLPDHPEIQYLFALASYYVTESPLTGLALRNLREADPESPMVSLAEGLLHRKQGNTPQAMESFTRAARQGVPDTHLLIGILHRENGDSEAAEKEFREAERVNPNNGQVLLELGKLFLARGDLKQAQARLEKALEAMPEAQQVHYQLGLLYRRLGLPEKAEHHLRLSRRQ